jgi:hypothetical protein
MAISFISSASNLGNSITSFPSHEKNDLLLIFAYNDGTSTPVTRPSGWISRTVLAIGASGSLTVAYKVAENNSTTSGTWTNADVIMVMVFRAGLDEVVSVNFINSQQATSATMTYGAQAAGTFETSAADQAFVAFIANRNNTNTLLPPGTMTNAEYLTDTTFGVAGHYQLARSTIWTALSVTEATSAAYRTIVVGLTAVTEIMPRARLIGSSNLIG